MKSPDRREDQDPPSPGIVPRGGWGPYTRTVTTLLLCLCSASILVTVVACVHEPSDGVKMRAWYDPMVVTHLFALLPIGVAAFLGYRFTMVFVIVTAAVSTVYHSFHERANDDSMSHAFADADRFFATALFGWAIVLIAINYNRQKDSLLAITAAVMGACGVALFLASGRGEEGDEEFEKAVERVHPLWHIMAFVAMGLVILNADTSDPRWWDAFL